LLIGLVEGVEIAVINVLATKDIGKELQDRGLSDTSLSNKKEGYWYVRLVRRCLDYPLLERLYVARKYG